MKIRFLICLLALSFLLCGCSDGPEPSKQLVSELNTAIKTTNSENRVSGSYMIEITFAEGVTLYYALGTISLDRDLVLAHADYTQTYLGKSVAAQNYYSDGKVVSVEQGESVTLERAPEAILGKFPYSKILELPEDIISISEKTTSVGKTIELVRGDTKTICDSVIGDDIYVLADVIKKPQPEKTQYGEAVCTYTLKDDRVVGCRYEFDVKLFDTPSYVPVYSKPESEYTLDIHVEAKVTFDCFGDNVEIREYSISEDEENS